jgi:hypothetical protein
MQLLFDSQGRFIAREEGGRLHSCGGANIGHYRSAERIFIDLSGRYLGEVVLGNRLLRHRRSQYRNVGFAVQGAYDNIGTIGNPGCAGIMEPMDGYVDIAAARFA